MSPARRTLVVALVVLAVVLSAGCIGLGDDPSDSASADDVSPDDDASEGDPSDGSVDDESWPSPPADAEVEYLENTTATFRTADGNVAVTLEVAATRSEKYAGLSNRGSLPADHGMVFVFDEPADPAFVMRDTYVPLDIIFVDESRTVTAVEQADPEPDTPVDELAKYESDEPSRYVIELEQGYGAEHGIEPGTEVVFHDELREGEGIVDG